MRIRIRNAEPEGIGVHSGRTTSSRRDAATRARSGSRTSSRRARSERRRSGRWIHNFYATFSLHSCYPMVRGLSDLVDAHAPSLHSFLHPVVTRNTAVTPSYPLWALPRNVLPELSRLSFENSLWAILVTCPVTVVYVLVRLNRYI